MDVYLIVVAVAMLAAVLVLMMIGIPLPFTMGACAVLGAYFAWGPNGLNKLEAPRLYAIF